MISNIIVTDDATESSEKAIEKAIELTKQLRAHLILLNKRAKDIIEIKERQRNSRN
jgi:hypothetical protein